FDFISETTQGNGTREARPGPVLMNEDISTELTRSTQDNLHSKPPVAQSQEMTIGHAPDIQEEQEGEMESEIQRHQDPEAQPTWSAKEQLDFLNIVRSLKYASPSSTTTQGEQEDGQRPLSTAPEWIRFLQIIRSALMEAVNKSSV
ncbi:unnamed protein product, partial [Amoebophrya sp. A25]